MLTFFFQIICTQLVEIRRAFAGYTSENNEINAVRRELDLTITLSSRADKANLDQDKKRIFVDYSKGLKEKRHELIPNNG